MNDRGRRELLAEVRRRLLFHARDLGPSTETITRNLIDRVIGGNVVRTWFQGKYGFVLRDAKPRDFRRCRGMPGFFSPTFEG